MKTRDYLFDNIKGLIIFSVVYLHLLGATVRRNIVAVDWLYTGVVMFCMSVMIFASGYFSKNLAKHDVENTIRTILIPYVLFRIIVMISSFVINGELNLDLFAPAFAMWYIVILFFYRLALPALVKIKGVLVLSFVAAFVSGFVPDVERFHTLGRAISNLPFFLLGYYFQPQMLEKLRRYARLPEKLILLAGFVVLTWGTSGLILENDWDVNVYQNNTTYGDAGMSPLLGLECRALFYVIGVLACLVFMVWSPRKKTFLCRWGRNSMVIYLFHIYFYELVGRFSFLKSGTWLNLLIVTVLAVFVTWLLSLDIFTKAFQWVIDLTGRLVFDWKRRGTPIRGEKKG